MVPHRFHIVDVFAESAYAGNPLAVVDLRLRIERGHEVGRPSLLRFRAREEPTGPRIAVGGRVVETVRGEVI